MTLNQFIVSNNIKPADSIVMKKKLFGMLNHYVIYLGISDYKHVFIANYTKGVKIISDEPKASSVANCICHKLAISASSKAWSVSV